MTIRMLFTIPLLLAATLSARPTPGQTPAQGRTIKTLLNKIDHGYKPTSKELLEAVAAVGGGINPCGQCFGPEVGPEAPDCNICHQLCTKVDPDTCVSCSVYPDQGCESIFPNGTMTAEMAQNVILLPSVLHATGRVIIKIAGVQHAQAPHPMEADALRIWYIGNIGKYACQKTGVHPVDIDLRRQKTVTPLR